MTRLRVAQPEDAVLADQRRTFNEAAEAKFREALAKSPVAMLVIYETENGECHWISVPGAMAVVHGLLAMACERNAEPAE